MGKEHWLFILFTALALLLMLAFSLLSRPRTRLYRCARRIFWALSALWISGQLGGVGISPASAAAAAMLGAPGYILAFLLVHWP